MTEIPIEDILLHDVIDVSENSTSIDSNKILSNQISKKKYEVDFNLTLPNNPANVFNGICLITDFEGSLKFLNPSFLSDKSIEESWFVSRNVMDCIHPEDFPLAIENLIKLIQENDSCISFKCRMGFGNKPYTMMSWNVTCSGQLLFFDLSENGYVSSTSNDVELKKDTLEDFYFDAIYWKMEVSKTINVWDKNVLSYLDHCTEIKRK